MARLKEKTENKKTKGVVSNEEHLENISKAERLLLELKAQQGKQVTIPLTETLSIEVSAKLSKKEKLNRIKRAIKNYHIQESKLLKSIKELIGMNKLELV